MKNRFVPDLNINTVFDINTNLLKAKGISAFVFDIDNTLATYAMPVPNEETLKWLDSLKKSGFKLCFVSNNKKERVRIFAQAANVTYIGRAMKPCKFYLKRACRRLGVSPQNAALVGDQLFTDVWGGNRMGMFTVLVTPISPVEDGFVKFKRRFEKYVLERAKGRNER